MHTTSRQIFGSGLAGLAATVPMTVTMMALQRQLPRHERHPLPPRTITEEAAENTGVAAALSEREKRKLTTLAHFGYGTAVGALYGTLPGSDRDGSSIVRGMLYGLGVWSVSYLGWLPAVGSDAAANRESARRNALMIASHLVWGASLALMQRAILGERSTDSA